LTSSRSSIRALGPAPEGRSKSAVQLELIGFQVHPDRRRPRARQAQIQRTIDCLGLNDFRRDRNADAELCWSSEVSLLVLQQESPFVAAALR